jgi:hypothetical protein
MMSIKLYEELLNKISEAKKINESLKEIEEGVSSIDGEEFFKNMKRKLNG